MSDFSYRVRIPTDEEYDRLMKVTDEENAAMHWDSMSSWVDDPELVTKHFTYRSNLGCASARIYDYGSADTRYVHVGFRPAFESLGNDTLPGGIADGAVVVIGTLYMNGEPVRVPQNPTYYGDIEDYIPNTELKFGPILDDPTYQVKAIKCGNVLVCDRCLLKRISHNDICTSFPNN